MLKTIFKDTLICANTQASYLPKGSKIISIQIQHGQPVIWFICDESQTEREIVTIRSFCTGETLSENIEQMKFLGTCQIDNLVFHFFEEARVAEAG